MSVVMRMRMPSKDTVCGMVFDLCGVWSCPVMNRICHQPENGDIPSWCPIICQLPEGHGRLVDADEFLKRAIGTKCFPEDDSRMLHELVGESITIVPAERKDNGETC